MSSIKLTVERVMGIVSILLGSGGIAESVRLYPVRTSNLVGDHTLPALIGILMIIIGFLLLCMVKTKPYKVEYPEKRVRNKMTYTMALMFIYLALIQFLGYTIASALIFFGLFRIFGSYSWLKCGIMSVIASVVFYFVFMQWLGMPFPTGIFNI